MAIAIYLIILFVNKIHVYLTQNCYRIKVEDKTIYLFGLLAKMSQTSLPTCCLPSNDRRQQIGCRVRQNACCSHTHSPDVKRDRNKVMEKHKDHGTVNEILYIYIFN